MIYILFYSLETNTCSNTACFFLRSFKIGLIFFWYKVDFQTLVFSSFFFSSWLYLIIMSCTHFRVNLHCIVAWMSRKFLAWNRLNMDMFIILSQILTFQKSAKSDFFCIFFFFFFFFFDISADHTKWNL